MALRSIRGSRRLALAAVSLSSQGDLVTALCVEAYDSLAAALTAARDARPPSRAIARSDSAPGPCSASWRRASALI